MHVVGIVAEFNPFHDGHRYLIDEVKRNYPDSLLIAVMSGNFVQRGEPSIYDKWERSKVAVENGIDLVVQLPTRFSNASSYFFAYGAVEILNSLGVDLIAFGSEIGDHDKILAIADVLHANSSELIKYAADMAKNGVSFPRARDEFLRNRIGNLILSLESKSCGDFILAPNDILGVDYILSSKAIGYEGSFFVVKRRGLEHNISASIIRDEFYSKQPELLKSLEDRFFSILVSKLSEEISTANSQRISKYDSELYNTLKKEWRKTGNIQDVENSLVSKMHTRSRIRRFLVSLIIGLDIPKRSEDCGFNAIYPLAFNPRGARYLKLVKNTSEQNISFLDGINNNYRSLDNALRSISEDEIRATDIYNVLMSNDLYENCELVRKPQFIEM